MTSQKNASRSSANAGFAATRWSIVLSAGNGAPGTASRRALNELIQAYWFPLYAFIRRDGHVPAEAEDLTQEFFTRFLEKNYLAQVDRAKGKFRSFLLASLKHFLANEWDKKHAQKRGGQNRPVSLDTLDAENRYAREAADNLTPERLFERKWALAVLDQVLLRLRAEYIVGGKGDLFDALKPALTEKSDSTYAAVAERLEMTPGAVKVAAHRLRRRYRDLLHEEIAQTIAEPGQIEEEIHYLLNCL